jgi:hypothetical protein
MPDDISPDRVTTIATAARVPLAPTDAERIARGCPYGRTLRRREDRSVARNRAGERAHRGRRRPAPPHAHLKTHHGFDRMRLRGLSGARDEFHLAAIVQNLKTLASYFWRPPPHIQALVA